MLKEILAKLVAGSDLSGTEAAGAMGDIMDGTATPAQVAAFATALRIKGETVEEIAGCAKAMRDRLIRIAVPPGRPILDTCGTGGDGRGTFNFSTAAAIVAAACGVTVAKHGNRAASSKCGSADLLESLGVKIELPPDRIAACLRDVGIAYLHAPSLQPAFKHAAAVRRELGFRTIFNLLGPLTNPAFADCQTVGLPDRPRVRPFAEVLRRLGSRSAFTFHGAGGLDEVSILGTTHVARLKRGRITQFTLSPKAAGLKVAKISDIAGDDPAHNTEIARRVLAGEKSAYRDGTILAAAVALMAADKAETPREGAGRAAAAIDSGAAGRKLAEWVEFTRRP